MESDWHTVFHGAMSSFPETDGILPLFDSATVAHVPVSEAHSPSQCFYTRPVYSFTCTVHCAGELYGRTSPLKHATKTPSKPISSQLCPPNAGCVCGEHNRFLKRRLFGIVRYYAQVNYARRPGGHVLSDKAGRAELIWSSSSSLSLRDPRDIS